MEFKYPDDATPLDDIETEGLLLTHITTMEELNRWEHDNILRAEAWAFGQNHNKILCQAFICRLHKKMFDGVWEWAGQFRKTMKNIGVDAYIIALEVGNLCEDCLYWIKNRTYPADEIGVRFHHRLVWIHPFANGNGRHSRLMTDLVLTQLFNRSVFTWGSGDLVSQGETREKYIEALRAADNNDFTLLLEFVRS